MSCRCDIGTVVPWSAFYDYATIYANKVSPEVLDMVLRAAMIEFARETLVIQKDIYVDLQDCVRDYELVVPEEYSPHMVREVVVNDVRIKQWPRASDIPINHFHYFQPDQILLGTEPRYDCPEAMIVRAVLIPAQNSCGVEKWLFDKYGEDIACGALSRAFLMEGTPWYSTRNGGIWLRRWKTQVNRAKSERGKAGVAGPTFMQARRFI